LIKFDWGFLHCAFTLGESIMAIKVDVRGDMDRIIADLGRTARDVKDVATVRALNKVIAQVRTAASREVRAAGYNLKAAEVKKGLATYNAAAGNLTAKVIASGRPIPLIKYGAKQSAKGGVVVNVLNGRKTIDHAFIATMPNGHLGVYVRVGNQHKKVSKPGRMLWSGLPIKELFGPSIPDGISNQAVQGALERLIVDKFPVILQQQIKYLTR